MAAKELKKRQQLAEKTGSGDRRKEKASIIVRRDITHEVTSQLLECRIVSRSEEREQSDNTSIG